MLTQAEARRQRRGLMKDIERSHRKQQREHLAHLRQALKDARALRRASLRQAKERCRALRLEARGRARELRVRLLEELRQAVRDERLRARDACAAGLAEARAVADRVARARGELETERRFRHDMRRIEHGNRQRAKEAKRTTVRERESESDDEVRAGLSPELVSLFERVKRSIKGSPRMSRLERFLQYVEENPEEYLRAIENRTDETIRELEKREREASRALRRKVPPEVYSDIVPF